MMFIDFPPQKKALCLVDFSLQRLITKESIKGDGIYRHAHYLISWAVELVQCVSCLHMFCPLNPDLLQKKQGDMFFLSYFLLFLPSFFSLCLSILAPCAPAKESAVAHCSWKTSAPARVKFKRRNGHDNKNREAR